MKRCGFALAGLLALAFLARADEAKSKDVAGIWEGSLKVNPAFSLRLVFKITKKGEQYAGTFDSVDQGAKDIKFDEVTFADGTLRCSQKAIKASYEGKLSKDGAAIEGKWKQGPGEFDLTLKRTEKASEVRRPQTPKKPFPYREEEVTFENKAAKAKFAGTLTLPKGDGPFPAVLLITGSGQQDRDETLFAHKPFLVLADHLTRRGIAVLRVDDRGVGGSTGDVKNATTEDFAGDVLAGVECLKGRPDIDGRHIGLMGHSEGGIIAPMVAARTPDVAFIVLLAGTGLPGEQVMYTQGTAVLKAMGATDKEVKLQREIQERLFAVVRSEKDKAEADKKVRAILAEEIARQEADEKSPKEEQKKKEAKQVLPEGQAQLLTTPWFRFFLAHDPRPTLQKVRCPVLALNGEKDVQVDARTNLPEIEKALREGGNTDVTVKEMPGLNHLFQKCKTGGVHEYASIEETFAPAALDLIADWISRHQGK